jgi:hypothetical protein
VRPVPGGRHPDLGTHNAQLGLGPECYLEVLAPDPASEHPADLEALLGVDLTQPRLATWVMRAENIEHVRARAEAVSLGAIVHGHRDNPDGTRVAWRVTEPFVFPLNGAVPFLIAWGDTPHPGSRLKPAGALQRLSVEHPEVDAVRAALKALGIDLPVKPGPVPRLRATIATEKGLATLA